MLPSARNAQTDLRETPPFSCAARASRSEDRMLRRTRTLNISTSLYALFGMAALVMSSQAVVGVLHAWTQVSEGARVEQLAAANQQLFAALQYVRQERGPTRVA